MSGSIPQNYRLQYSRQAINEYTAVVAKKISQWASDVRSKTGKDLLAVGILRGSVFFYSDLLRQLSASVELSFCRSQTYLNNVNTDVKGHRISVEDVAAEGRHILLVDDICDTGTTLERLQKVFLDLGAKEIKTAVLIYRKVPDAKHVPTWNVFEYSGPEWFVGCGLDDANRNSNLPDIYIIEK